MKQTLFWKRLDFGGQMLMLLPLLLIASPQSRPYSFLTYFSVGLWQIISCGLTVIVSAPRSKERRSYERILLSLLGLIAFVLAGLWAFGGKGRTPLLQVFGYIRIAELLLVLITGPILAIWYARMTLEELYALRHRAEVHWKL